MGDKPVANLSAAIATLDRPEGLLRCLEALREGDVLPAEIIIIDQSEQDATERAVREMRPMQIPVRYIRQRRRGLSASRNEARRHARYPHIAVTDDDCVPDRAWISTIDRTFAQPSAPDVVTGRVLPLGPETPGLYAVSTRDVAERAEFTGKVEPWRVGTGGNFAASQALLERVGPFDERLGAGTAGGGGEDMDMLYRLTCAGARVLYEPDALVFHERQTKARRIASRTTYGRGIGAFCSLRIRGRDSYALYLLYRWTMNHVWALARALRQRQWTRVHEEYLMLVGTFRGTLYGFGARLS